MRILAVGFACLAVTLGVPAGPISAQAVSGPALRVVTLDRHGHSVAGQVEVANLRDGRPYSFSGGRFHHVEPGTYEVVAAIGDAQDGSDTVGSALVTVSGRTTTTIDARRGRRVGAALAPAPSGAYDQFLVAEICAGNAMAAGGGRPGSLFVIPSRRKREELGVSSQWNPSTPARSRPVFLGASVYRGGVPAPVAPTYRQASLTSVTVSGRTGAEFGDVALSASQQGDDACAIDPRQLRTNLTLPYTVTLRMSAGRWSLWQDGTSHLFGPLRAYRSGHSYHVTVGAAAWGPDGNLPVTDQYGGTLAYTTIDMFADPHLPYGPDARVEYRLTHAGRVLVHRIYEPSEIMFPAKLPAAGWYGLTARATRVTERALPAGTLSLRSTVHLHFYADPTRTLHVRAFVTRFVPASLDAANRTGARATWVWLRPLRGPSDANAPRLPDRVRRVRAWASGDGGRTWRAVQVVHAGGRWRANVPNPRSGFVALRATVDDTHGGWATTTVYRAYRVG